MNNIDISVIIPVYNVAEYLEECLDPVVKLTEETSAEVILVDDGSTDGSSEILRSYSEKHGSVKYYHRDNAGVAAARNFGIEKASGRYVMFVDADDVIIPDVYAEMLAIADKNDADCVRCAYVRLKGKSVKPSPLGERVNYGQRETISSLIKHPNFVYDTTCWNKLIRRSLLAEKNIRFPEGVIYNEDAPFMLEVLHHANKIGVCFKTGYLWRIRTGDSISVTQKAHQEEILRGKVEMMRRCIEFCKSNVSEKAVLDKLLWKTFATDLTGHIKQLRDFPEDEALKRMEYMDGFISEYCDDSVKEKLPAIFTQIYREIHDRDHKKVNILTNFNEASASNAPFIYGEDENGKVILKYPDEYFDRTTYDAGNELTDRPPQMKLLGCEVKDNRLKIHGHLYQKRVCANDGYPQQVKAFLLSSTDNTIIDLETATEPTPELDGERGTIISHEDYSRHRYPCDQAGFSIIIDPEKIKDHCSGPGEFTLLLSHKNVLSRGTQTVKKVTGEMKKVLNSWKHETGGTEISATTDRSGCIFIAVSDQDAANRGKGKAGPDKSKKKKELFGFPIAPGLRVSLQGRR